jgi:hypothetical protein
MCEPLRGKIEEHNEYGGIEKFFIFDDVKSAVEGCIEEIKDNCERIHQAINNPDDWEDLHSTQQYTGADVISFIDIIKKWFGDVIE